MKTTSRLTAADRNLFALVTQAIFTNPFDDERLALDAQISGVPDLASISERDRLQLLLPRITGCLKRLEREGPGRLESFEGEDRRLVEYAYLFHFFHRHIDDFDDLIQAQLSAGDAPCAVPFARDLLAGMRRRGFCEAECSRYLALFFQIRRAYYFIEKGLVGRSPCMKQLRKALWYNVFTHDIGLYDRYLWNSMEDFSTLLLGETGTGKGTAAAAIGRSGCIPFDAKKNAFEASFTKTFLAINLSQYPESLIESELFGHRKGSFTGAVDHHEGVFARSSPHGALFLDEIGEISVPVQIKLLQVLQERTFSPVGSHAQKRFEGRVIAATNSPLNDLRARGLFRDDFFYRLCSDVITVPPLRQRIQEVREELDDLVDLFVRRIVGEPSPDLVEVVGSELNASLPAHYAWPGNVREVEQAVRRILLTGRYEGAGELDSTDEAVRLENGIRAGTFSAKELLGHYCTLLYRRSGRFEDVSRRTGLDPRTVKKHIERVNREETS